MKITIEIPDDKQADMLAFLAKLFPAKAERLPEILSDDPSMRDLPMPTNIPPLPPLPEGKTRWVNRGTFENLAIDAGQRDVRWLPIGEDEWTYTTQFSCTQIHIEAI